MSAPVFLAATDTLLYAEPGGLVPLDGAEGRHAVTVRRLRVGEPVVLTDGAGRGVSGTVAELRGREALDVTVTERHQEPEPALRVTVVQALPKADRGEKAVEMLTEVGVDTIVPWAAARCVTRWTGPRGDKALDKWRATAREAGKQSRRLRFPQVTEKASTSHVRELLASASVAGVLHEEGDSAALSALSVPHSGEVLLLVGPEGGVAPEELAEFDAAGARRLRLGPSVLRTSTAGVAAAAVVLACSERWA